MQYLACDFINRQAGIYFRTEIHRPNESCRGLMCYARNDTRRARRHGDSVPRSQCARLSLLVAYCPLAMDTGPAQKPFVHGRMHEAHQTFGRGKPIPQCWKKPPNAKTEQWQYSRRLRAMRRSKSLYRFVDGIFIPGAAIAPGMRSVERLPQKFRRFGNKPGRCSKRRHSFR